MTTTNVFDSAAEFTYSDANLVEFDGTLRLVDLRPTDALFYASYSSSLTGNWGTGGLNYSIVNGTPEASGGYAVLAGTERFYYTDGTNTPTSNAGCIRAVVRPDYSGTPGSQQDFCNISDGTTSNNRITIFHGTGGSLTVRVYNASGTQQFEIAYAWSPTSGTDYEIEFNFNGTSGVNKLFIDGTQVGTDSTTWTRTNTGGEFINVGRSAGTTAFGLNSLVIFNSLQHSTTYTPGESVSETKYSTAVPYASTTAITGFITSLSVSATAGSDTLKYVIVRDGTDYYWTGSAWASSVGYAQSSTINEIINHINGLRVDNTNHDLSLKIYLASTDGSSTPTVTSATISYREGDPIASLPTMCYITGWLYDQNGPLSNVAILVRPKNSFANEEIFIAHDWQTFDTTSNDGYFNGRIWESATPGQLWQFKIGTKLYEVQIPNQTTVAWSDLSIGVAS